MGKTDFCRIFPPPNCRLILHFHGKNEIIAGGWDRKRRKEKPIAREKGQNAAQKKKQSPLISVLSPFIPSRLMEKSQENQGFSPLFHFSTASTTTTIYINNYYNLDGGRPFIRIGGTKMHFRIQTDEINYGLGMVTRAIAARPVKQVYDGVLVETMDDGLVLTCTDGEISIKAKVSAAVEEDGCALLPAKLFAEMMRKQPAGEVDVRIDERMRAIIRSRGSNTSMACMPAEDFPDIRDVTGDHHVLLPCRRLRDAIGKVLFAVSTDESRKILTGVLMEVYENESLLVGIDGFRMALQRITAENTLPAGTSKDHISAVVPGRILGEVSKMLPDSDDEASIVFNSSHIMYSFGGVRVYATLLTGEFIDYQKILPASWTTEAMVMRTAFSDAIDRCSLMAREGKNNLIHLRLQPEGKMEMTANAERGDVHEEMEIGMEGNELDITFNSRYLTDMIHNVEGERLCMCFNSSVSPCMIKPVEGREFTFLVLPVRGFNR